jgi:hypothetical protein
MNYKVLNNSIDFFGARFLTKSANILEDSKVNVEAERRKLFSEVFEQFMFFDNCVIKTGKLSTSLYLLIKELGINKTEELVQNGDIQFLFWTPYIFTEQGKHISGPIVRKFGEDSDLDVYDDSQILGKDPLIVTDYAVKQYDLEKIVDFSLNNIPIHPDRKKILKKIVLDKYIVPQISDAQLAKDYVIDAYRKNSFEKFGLGFNKEPNMLGSVERMKLMNIAYDVFENTLIANHNIKYYSNYNFFATFKRNLFEIANSLKVTTDASILFEIENIPDLKKLFIEEKMDFKSVFDLRQLSNAKYFRKWLNEKSESVDSIEITKEYLNELKNSSNFFNKSSGKLLKTLGVFSVGAGLGAAISGIEGSIIGGGIVGITKDLGLSLLDAFWLEKIAAGKAPSMFIEDIRKYIDIKNN